MANLLKENASILQHYLLLQTCPVGVRFLQNQTDYEQCANKEVQSVAYYCYLVKLASGGQGLKASSHKMACETASQVLGLQDYDHEETGIQGWDSIRVFKNKELAKAKHRKLRPDADQKYGISVSALHQCTENPDSIILIANAYQAMRVMQGYHYYYSERSISMTGMCGVCYESTAAVESSHDLHVSLLCSGTRFICKWKDDTLMISFPYGMLDSIIDGLIKTAQPCESDEKKKLINAALPDINHPKLKLRSAYFHPPKYSLGS